ncbi:hypothetical protein TWF718_002378 [Orbilia javanica]|uniref:DUF7587 domain-containing protein n=1 Tax=Orbilia javanica TaxID=47235 RepID=A0AAN8MNB9_9PEZI
MASQYENSAASSSGFSESATNPLPGFCLRRGHQSLPKFLYRVHIPGRTKTKYTQAGGFRSLGSEFDHSDSHEFLSKLINHLTWSKKSPSPFITTLEREKHAEDWAKVFLKRRPNCEFAQIMKINTQKIGAGGHGQKVPIVRVLQVVSTMRRRGHEILPDGRDDDQIDDEYLCMYSIPRAAIVGERTIWNPNADHRGPQDGSSYSQASGSSYSAPSQLNQPLEPVVRENTRINRNGPVVMNVSPLNTSLYDAVGEALSSPGAPYEASGGVRVGHPRHDRAVPSNGYPQHQATGITQPVSSPTSRYDYPNTNPTPRPPNVYTGGGTGRPIENTARSFPPNDREIKWTSRSPSPGPVKKSRLRKLFKKFTRND